MKILYLNPVGFIGGAERCLLDLLVGIKNHSPDIELHLILGGDGLLFQKAQELGISVKLLPIPSEIAKLGEESLKGIQKIQYLINTNVIGTLLKIRVYLRELNRIVREISPTIIHSNGNKFHLLTRFISYEAPIVWHIHDFISTRPIISKILKWSVKKNITAIAISKAAAQDIQKVLSKMPIKMIYNGTDTDYFSPRKIEGQILDNLANLEQSTKEIIRVGLVATFAKWKGHDIFLEAASKIIKRSNSKSIRFYIIGEPLYHTIGSQFSVGELKNKTIQFGIENKVGFIGFQENIVDIYRALDIVVHASTKPEPFGLTIIEAMSCGKPVIVINDGGAAELFTDKYDAIGIPSKNSTELASAIDTLINNQSLKNQISLNARQTVLNKFSSERFSHEIINLYNNLDHISKL